MGYFTRTARRAARRSGTARTATKARAPRRGRKVRTPALTALMVLCAAAFAWMMLAGPGAHSVSPNHGCYDPAQFAAGAHMWSPADDWQDSPAWSVTSITGWYEFTCQDGVWESGQ